MLYFTFHPSSPSSADKVEELSKARNYANRDEITVSPGALGSAYGEKIKMFYDEHIHEDEEIRYVLKGTGYFDVRDAEDRWLRISAEPGDLLILPAGIYHRFTVDEGNVSRSCSGRHSSRFEDDTDCHSTCIACDSSKVSRSGPL